MLPVHGNVVEQLLRLHEKVVEPVDFRHGVGQAATAAHHRVKTVGMGGVEREEQRHDRVPRVRPDRTHQIAANFALEDLRRRHVPVGRLVIDGFILT